MQTLSELQRSQWSTDGYLHLEGVLSPEEVAFFSAELDRFRALPGYEPSDVPRGHYAFLAHADDLDTEGFMDRRNLLGYHDAFIGLIDRPDVFDLIVDIMGPYLMLSMTQAIARPSTETFPGYTHTDGGEALRYVRVSETSRPIAMKAMYLLSDVEGTNAGNLTVFPGSHMRPFPDTAGRWPNPHSPGVAQLQGKAGDCYLFPHSLWHGPAPNRSGKARKTILYNYCQMFARSYDFEVVPEIAKRCTPRQRRLLGDMGHEFRPGSYFYAPRDQSAVITGDPNVGESVLADSRPDSLPRD
ncbi:MAG: phytanoyl-CoA dioxygenase family protein [Gammaproteobacteria bacterium]